MDCPKCQSDQLSSMMYEGVDIQRCSQCHGIWLAEDRLRTIVETKEDEFSKEVITSAINDAFAGIPEEQRDKALQCPECSADMRAVNSEYGSGIIIDRCAEHGVWLDEGELRSAQAYSEYWEDEKSKHTSDWGALATKVASDEHDRHALDEATRQKHATHVISNIFNKFAK